MTSAVFECARVHRGVWDVPSGWTQGRGAWGGLVVGAAVRAAQAALEEASEPRTVSVQMMAPVPAGAVNVVTRQLRRGSATSVWRVQLHAGDADLAEATVTFGRSRGIDVECPPSAPPVAAPWHDCAVVDVQPPVGPEFARHLEFRPVAGYPYSGRREDVVSWVRPKDRPARAYDAGSLLGLVDALWPAALIAVSEPHPMATISFTAALLVDPSSVATDEPLLHVGHLVGSAGGYVTEHRQLWTSDGRLAVHNTQIVAIIR